MAKTAILIILVWSAILSSSAAQRPKLYKIAIIADKDKEAVLKEIPYTYRSNILKGTLTFQRIGSKHNASVQWDRNTLRNVDTNYAYKGRGSELSDLIYFNDKLLTFDDRTGIVYEIERGNSLVPWSVLSDGAGNETKGFKSEWATVKDNHLYVGSLGMEWVGQSGTVENNNSMYVKKITPSGEVTHENWFEKYDTLRKGANFTFPGFIWHEAGMWSDHRKQWVFLPRKCSKLKFDHRTEEDVGCNLILTADEDFSKVNVTNIRNKSTKPNSGFSSFKFVPNSKDKYIMALKTVEKSDLAQTYITVIQMNGVVLIKDTKVADAKYEGLEFL